jgi:hypothetical protein
VTLTLSAQEIEGEFLGVAVFKEGCLKLVEGIGWVEVL